MKYLLVIVFIIPNLLFTQNLVLKYNCEQVAISVECPDSSNCFIVVVHGGDDINWGLGYNKVYKSTDQGTTWVEVWQSKAIIDQEPPVLLNAMEASSPHPDYVFMAMFEERYIKKSCDGGKTFENINLGTGGTKLQGLRQISMKDTNTGIVIGDSMFVAMTNDSWKTFKKIDYYSDIPRKGNIGPLSMYSPLFRGADTLLFVGGLYNFKDSTALDVDSTSIGAGIFTLNYNKNECSYVLIPGTKWDTTNGNRNPIYESFRDIFFVNDTLGFICGQKRTGIGDAANDIIYKTTNSGKTWEKVLDNYEPGFSVWGLQQISFKDELNGIAVGAISIVCVTGDGGETWGYLEIPDALRHKQTPTMDVSWSGEYPIIGTYGAGFWRVEGPDGGPPVFKPAVSPSILTEDYNFGTHYINLPDTLMQNLKIYNLSDTVDLRITRYSALKDISFSTSLPKVDFINPIIIKPQEYYEYTVFFKPDEVRKYNDSIVFYSNAKDSDNVAVFSGEGIDTSTSVNDELITKKWISISPNPASEYIEINLGADSRRQTADGRRDIQIFDVYGQCVLSVGANGRSPVQRIDVSGFPDGIYFVIFSESSELSESYRIYKFIVIK